MWTYEKRLEFPIKIRRRDLKLAQDITTQYGGPNGELAAALRYLNQRYLMPDSRGKALLTDIGTEELAHVEMISTMLKQLTEGASIEEMKQAGFDQHYAQFGNDLFPTDARGNPFSVLVFAAVGDPIADLYENMAAEEKARATYENLIDLTRDPDLLQPLHWLRQREIVHFQRFEELMLSYKALKKE